ncbi:MAG: DUF1553 domain-containing protein, partial [Planctomycetales bacterium]|nr:DUF1553 domain-containing protein [Planctomycetales bacterium]
HFGERWGRHWLDLVRYAESRGHEFDVDAENAFQYRDYIIRAFNSDLAYDQLIREHIAGDLLASPRLHPSQGFNESILGTGFWFLGEWVHSPVDIRKDETDRFDNMLDVMSKTFLGMTVACARCHDHKFDAISTADYYSLCGFLQSSDFRQVRFESLEHNRQVAERLVALDSRYRAAVGELLPAFSPPSVAHGGLPQSLPVAVDYTSSAAAEFLQDGFLFGAGPRAVGTAYLGGSPERPKLEFARRAAAVSDSFWNGLQSLGEAGGRSRSALSKLPRSGRTLRTPTFRLVDGQLLCRVRGRGHVVACVDSHRLISGPLHRETVQAIQAEEPWVRLQLDRYVGHRLHLEFTPDEDASLEVSLVLQTAETEAMQHVERAEEQLAQAVSRYAQAVDESLDQQTGTRSKLDGLLASWAAERKQLQETVQRRSHLAMAMLDGTGEEDHVLIRGSSAKPGAVEPRHFLTAISGDQPLAIPRGSGRLQLADHIASASNPLTWRVMVNRIWHILLGRGIVPTTDDFGVLGQPPTHPELLDHLATRFLDEGRSVKELIRHIVLSRTYRMGGAREPRAAAADPSNLLWHYRPPKRLEGEALRDALLAISGQLDESLFGEPVAVHLTPFMEGRGRPAESGPLDGRGRRSIYLAVRRNFLSPFMQAFDAPTPYSTRGRRHVSNVPAQALILMNDPLVVQQAGSWAERSGQLFPPAAAEEGDTGEAGRSVIQARIHWLYLTAFARPPTAGELQLAERFVLAQSPPRGVDSHGSEPWSDLAHALINTKEFLFLR